MQKLLAVAVMVLTCGTLRAQTPCTEQNGCKSATADTGWFTSLNPSLNPSVTVSVVRQSEADFISKTLYPATVLLFSQDAMGTMKMLCTATAISHDKGVYEFATASHCAANDDKETHRAVVDKSLFFISSDKPNVKDFLEAKVEGCGMQTKGDDFCIFKVTTDKQFPVVAIGTDTTDDTEQVVNVASPLGLGKQTFFGRVSRAQVDRSIQDDDNNINWTNAMLLQLPGTNGGSSGSAIVCLSQRAICGFVVGTVGKTTMVAIPISRFKKFRELLATGKYKWYSTDDDE